MSNIEDFGELPDVETTETDDDDFAAEEQREEEAEGFGISDEAQPDTQGEDPLEAELGEEGQGDLAPEDL